MSSIRSSTRRAPIWLSVLLGVIGILLIVAAVLYFTEPAHQLPSFFPGHTPHGTQPRTKHGIAALVVGLVVLAGAWLSSGRRRI